MNTPQSKTRHLTPTCLRYGSLPLILATAIWTTAQVGEAATFTFGSDNDGLAGFTQTTSSLTEIWTTQTDSVQYRNQDSGTKNSSFLRAFTLDRTNGNSYSITATVFLNDGYTDDNNRVGIYLFGDASVVPNEDEAGAIGLIFNTDDTSTGGSPGANNPDGIALRVGIDSTELSAAVRNQTNTPYAQDLFGSTITLGADISFFNDGLNDLIQIDASLTEPDNTLTTTSISVLAADYTGDYFGFVTRARARNYVEGGSNSAEGRSLPWVMDYQSFSIVPEPSTGLLALIGGSALMIRRRPSSKR